MEKEQEKKIYNLLIVDESGSMSLIRKQAFTGMNETLTTIVSMQEKYSDMQQRVILVTFNSEHCSFVLDDTPAAKVRKLRWNEYTPCGCTPLYDAIGKGIAKVNAICAPDDNVLVTIITDGGENSSTHYSLRMIKNLIDKLKEQNWTFTFIGTDNLDVETMAGTMGIDDRLSFAQTDDGTAEMFEHERAARMRYNRSLRLQDGPNAGSYFESDE